MEGSSPRPGRAPRDVVRALLLDGAGRVLLVRWRDPVTRHEFLEPPGGAREPDETYEDALRREVAEETGLDVHVGAFVAEIDHDFTFAGERYECRERYYACRAGGGARRPPRLDPVELAGVVGVEWWSIDDLASSSGLALEPPELLEMLRAGRPPDATGPGRPGRESASDAGRAGPTRDREEDAWTGCTSAP